jgi:arabinose-5-phosphate isomerase
MQAQEVAVECFQNEAQAVLDLIPLLTDDFEHTVDLIYHCRGRLIITGVGKSGHIGVKIAATLASTGTPSFFVNPLDAFHGDLGMITQEDIVLAISNSGQTDELLRIIPYLIERNIPLIGMSGNQESLLAQYSRFHLNIAVKKEACPLNLTPTSSTVATLAMGDALACALMQKRNFTENDYARFHPGGSLGKRLLTKVKDVMHKDNLPIVPPDMKLNDALIRISNGKLGLVVVIDENNIVGIVTDGDIRRAMQNSKADFFNLSVNEIMTKAPKIIHIDTKIDKAESMMNDFKIHSLAIVDDNNMIVGIVDEFDCRI